MRRLLASSVMVALGSVMPSHAIFGIGGHWAPAPTLSVKKGEGEIASRNGQAITVSNGESDPLQGFGIKIWVDALPFIDIEAASNVQFGTYDVTLNVPGVGSTPVEFEHDVPFAPSSPAFVRIHNDISVLYPFLKFPPAISIAKIYGGAGMSYGLATEVLSADFAKKAMEKSDAPNPATVSEADLAKYLGEAAVDEGLQMGVGFYLQVGAKVKPPIVPIAIYADAKYQFFSMMPDAVDGPSVTLELGGALAF